MSEIDILNNKKHLHGVIEFIKSRSFYSMDIIIDVLSAYECCVEEYINESPNRNHNCIKEITGISLDTIKEIMNLLTEYHGNLL
jgi:hypothetical protein